MGSFMSIVCTSLLRVNNICDVLRKLYVAHQLHTCVGGHNVSITKNEIARKT